jgi:hypothetical protein
MVLVVIVALIYWGLILVVRARRYHALVAYHENLLRVPPTVIAADPLTGRRTDDPAETERREREWAASHIAIRDKYQRAARSRWLPTSPDPPEPE